MQRKRMGLTDQVSQGTRCPLSSTEQVPEIVHPNASVINVEGKSSLMAFLAFQ